MLSLMSDDTDMKRLTVCSLAALSVRFLAVRDHIVAARSDACAWTASQPGVAQGHVLRCSA